jgi:hypothetical protein
MPRIKKEIYTFKCDYTAEGVKEGAECRLIVAPYFRHCDQDKPLVKVELLSDRRKFSCFAWRIGL